MNSSQHLILVVDDVPQNLRVIGALLEQHGYDTTFATSGQQALQRLEMTKPDLILLDLRMPEMNGIEVCKILKADPNLQDIPAIFLTAERESDAHIAAFDAGAADYITKPFQPKEVLARIQNQLTNIELRRQLQFRNQKLQEEIKIRRCAEINLVQAKEAAERANQIKGIFLANMSHELRSPLNAILGFTQLLTKAENLTPKQQETLKVVYRSGEHLLALINDVLDLSKIEAGRIELDLGKVNLRKLCQEIAEMLGFRARKKGLTFNINIAANVPPYIESDRLKLRQVLINLISNGIKFTEVGTISLNIDYRDDTEDTGYLILAVSDTGVGIAPQDLCLLFQPFMQTQAGKQNGEGTGLGLAISRKYIQLLGGDIDVTSHVGQGTTFELEIPVRCLAQCPQEETHSESSWSDRPILSLAPNQPQYRILIADDRASNTQLLTELLSRVGFQVKTAANGAEAIAQWQSFQPHLIWMDIKMPEIDGYAASRSIRQQEAQQPQSPTKIIALTASILTNQQHLALEAGCDDCLSKPFGEAEIFAKMKQHLNIEYIYCSPTPPSPSGIANCAVLRSLDALEQMPRVWLEKLEQAILALDIEAIYTIIVEISPEKPNLAVNLREYIDDFDYDSVLKAIANCISSVKPVKQ